MAKIMTKPWNFSWFVEGKLAGMSYPEDTDIPFLTKVGIKRLINTTEDEADYSQVARANGVIIHNIHVEEFRPPSVQQIQEFLDILDSSTDVGVCVCVHHAVLCVCVQLHNSFSH